MAESNCNMENCPMRRCGTVRTDGRDIVLNVMTDSERNILIFTTLAKGGGELTYSSKSYCMSDPMGLFRLFEDFFTNSLSFFTSSVTVQSFLLTLYDFERKFYKEHGLTFSDYYGVVTDAAVEAVNERDSIPMYPKPMDMELWRDYGIVDESILSTFEKGKVVKNDGYLPSISTLMLNEFMTTLGRTLNEYYCAICIKHGHDAQPFALMDHTVRFPTVFRSKRYITVYLDMMTAPLTGDSTDLVDDMRIDMWKVDMTAKLRDMMNIFDGNGRLKVEYDSFESSPLFNGCDGIYRYEGSEFEQTGFAASIG